MVVHTVSKLSAIVLLIVGLACVVPAASATPAPPVPGDVHSAAYLGVMVESVSPEQAASLHLKDGSGAAITGVDQDGPAGRAGLKSGDIVITFNGTPVDGSDEFASLIHASAPGKTVSMTVLRGGRSKEIKVTLGDWKQMAAMPKAPVPPGAAMPFVTPIAPLPPRMYPDIDIPSFTSLSMRHGVVVEPMSPQLCDFFGVPQNQGVLVRSVEKGSPGAAAGLKAGDVIVKVNQETVHDMADWRRALKTHSGKLTVTIVRDKKEQSVDLNLPANTSELNGKDWDAYGVDMQAMNEEMQKLGPELAQHAKEMATVAQLDQRQIDEINRQAQDAVKSATPEIKKQTEAARKQAEIAVKTMTPEMRKQVEAMSKQAAAMRVQSEQIRKEVAKMSPELERNARQMADALKPTAKQLSDLAREMSESVKGMVAGPEFQKQMEQLRKDLEQEKREWQQIFKGSDSNHF